MADHGPNYQGKTAYNFSAATGSNSLVYGSSRPGAKVQVCFAPDLKLPKADVDDWVAFMKEKGIQKVVGLLKPDELLTYEQDIGEAMKAHFEWENVDINSDGMQKAVDAINGAVAEGKKVVVHCWAGGGRTGNVLAAWLASQPGSAALGPEAAAQEVISTAAAVDAKRRVDVEEVQKALAA